jgi:hypothetical protein
MRTITDHLVNPINEALRVVALDEPGQGNACHAYRIDREYEPYNFEPAVLTFQNGPLLEVGTNGITHEALLAVVIDRLRGFQSGEYKCRENAIALTHIEEALLWLQKRTRDRALRGVEGTHQV